MRAAMNAIFYLLRTGCPWRYLFRDPFPPRSTVYNIFRKLQHEGVWELIREELLVALREQRAARPAAIIDSQSLKAAEKGVQKQGQDDAVDYDAGKKLKGRKLHALVEVEGLPLRVVVYSAGMQDRDGAGVVLEKPANAFPGSNSFRQFRLQRSPGQRRRREGSGAAHQNRQTIRRHERLHRIVARHRHVRRV